MRQGSDNVTAVPRPKTELTAEQQAAIKQAQARWDESDRAEEEAWRATQGLRDLDVPDLVICESIRQVTKPTLNRKLGPRKAPKV